MWVFGHVLCVTWNLSLHTHTCTSVITLWSSSQSVVKTSQTEWIFRHMLEMPGNTSLIPRLYVCKLGSSRTRQRKPAEKTSRENQQGEPAGRSGGCLGNEASLAHFKAQRSKNISHANSNRQEELDRQEWTLWQNCSRNASLNPRLHSYKASLGMRLEWWRLIMTQ